MTLTGPLTKKSEIAQSSPIHRGVFINHAVLCKEIPPPPDIVSGLPEQTEGMTNRERVETHTGAGTCGAGCHSNLINPPGFAFEHYDELGRYRLTDNEQYFFQEYGVLSWLNGVEFSQIVSESVEAHQCYSEHLLTYYLGRTIQDADEPLLQNMTSYSRSGASILELLTMALTSDSFTMRGVE